MQRNPTQSGVTLVEVLVTLSVAAILATLAAPSFNSFIGSTRLSTTQSQIFTDLNLARSEAIKRNARVLMCTRNNAGTGCATGTDWQNGWVVCIDADRDNACDAVDLLSAHQALPGSLTLTGAANLIRFNPNGTQGAGAAATLTLASTGLTSKTFSVAATGNITKQ